MIENCGPLHADCACTDECPDCGGALEEDVHLCDCRHCRREGEDEFRCLGCDMVWEKYELKPVRTAQRRRDGQALAAWKGCTVGEVVS